MKTFVCLALFVVTAWLSSAATTPRLEWNRLEPLPNPHGVAAPFAGVSGNSLIVAGGANFPAAKPWAGGTKVWHKDVWVLEQSNGKWKSAGPLAMPRAYGVSATYRDEVICAGGSDDTKHYDDVFTLAWRVGGPQMHTLPSLPQPLANACGAILDGTLYIAGGIATPSATNALSTFFALDLETSRWRTLPSWPGPPRMLAMAAVQDGAFFVVGGASLRPAERGPVREYLRDGYRFDAKSGWRKIAELPFPVAAAPSPAPTFGNDSFLVLASDDGSRAHMAPLPEHPGFNAKVLAYNTKRDVWTQIGTNPAPRVTVPVVRWNDRWIVPSGEVRPGVRSPEVWSLTIAPESR
jgi:N-acetylneuraminate epimerase